MYMYMYMYMYIYMNMNMYMYLCVYVYTYTYTYIHTYIYIYINIPACATKSCNVGNWSSTPVTISLETHTVVSKGNPKARNRECPAWNMYIYIYI